MATRSKQKALTRLSDSTRQQQVSAIQRSAASSLTSLENVDVRVTLDWGQSHITVQEARTLDEASLLHLDQRASDPVDIHVNGKLFGRGKLVVTGGAYGVQLLELVDKA